jgi:hypothetical protein
MAEADYLTNAICVLITGAGPKPSTNPLRAACAGFPADLAGYRPVSIPLNAVDLEDRVEHLRKGAHRSVGLSDCDPPRHREPSRQD